MRAYARSDSSTLKSTRLKLRPITEIASAKKTTYRKKLAELRGALQEIDRYYRNQGTRSYGDLVAAEKKIKGLVDALNSL
ncbi:MAG: hypothetical protein Q7R47_06015 [Candidatus Diapherotrites archaeon]|nr:hypothetical protein [Candidatus Diapherotrites archaeon]